MPPASTPEPNRRPPLCRRAFDPGRHARPRPREAASWQAELGAAPHLAMVFASFDHQEQFDALAEIARARELGIDVHPGLHRRVDRRQRSRDRRPAGGLRCGWHTCRACALVPMHLEFRDHARRRHRSSAGPTSWRTPGRPDSALLVLGRSVQLSGRRAAGATRTRTSPACRSSAAWPAAAGDRGRTGCSWAAGRSTSGAVAVLIARPGAAARTSSARAAGRSAAAGRHQGRAERDFRAGRPAGAACSCRRSSTALSADEQQLARGRACTSAR